MKIKQGKFPWGNTRLLQRCLNPYSSPKPAQKRVVCVWHKKGRTRSLDRIVEFNFGSKPRHRPIFPTNRAKKPMTRTLHRPPPLTPTLDWRSRRRRRRRRRQRWWAHPNRISQGDFWQEPNANAGQCCPVRTKGASVWRQDDTVPTASAAGAPTSNLCACRWKKWIMMEGEGGVRKWRGARGQYHCYGGPRRRRQSQHKKTTPMGTW